MIKYLIKVLLMKNLMYMNQLLLKKKNKILLKLIIISARDILLNQYNLIEILEILIRIIKIRLIKYSKFIKIIIHKLLIIINLPKYFLRLKLNQNKVKGILKNFKILFILIKINNNLMREI